MFRTKLGAAGVIIVLTAGACMTEAPEEPLGKVFQGVGFNDYYDWPLNNNICSNDVPGSPVPCGPDEEMTCTTECVDPSTAGESCAPFHFGSCGQQDVCVASDGSGRWLHSCVEISTSNWECRKYDDGGNNLWGACDPDDPFDLCPADSWCIDQFECTGENPLYQDAAFCWPFRLQGMTCDSGAGSPECFPCAPETDCVAATSAAPSDGYCRKECVVDDDCPCGSDGSEVQACNGGYCYECRSEGDFCGDLYACCDDTHQLECGGEDATCCRRDGQDCTSDANCCVNSYCADNTVCAECTAIGDSCTTDEECCGHDCSGGECKVDCEGKEGKKCSVPGAKGECKPGKWSCDNYVLTCKPNNESSTEVCDGLDNDCDGKVDDGAQYVGDACQKTLSQQDGCGPNSVTVSGERECINDSLECVAEPGRDYCTAAGSYEVGDCGVPVATCFNDNDCIPNHVCNSSGSCVYVPVCGATPVCWLPSDKGACPY